MQTTVFIFIIFLFLSCHSQKAIVSELVSDSSEQFVMSLDTINKRMPDKKSVILIGKADRLGFSQKPFESWFNKNLLKYKLDTAAISDLKPLLNNIKIVAFMGTWCKDSKRETPRFYKVLDAVNYDYNNLELFTVNRQKKTPEKFEAGLGITNVPTFIFYKDGKELNRIVEFPVESLEKDMLTILSNKEYTHSYQ